jgi:hypothetical protein
MLLKFRALALALVLCALCYVAPLHAQVASMVGTCGIQTLGTGNQQLTIDSTGKLCVNATVTASISPFTATSVGTPISVTTGGVSGTLPAGTVVVASNAGSTNTAYCALGASATTANQPIPPNSWFAFTVGLSTQLTCITAASTTTVNTVGGAGSPSGAGGGGGGGGGAVTIASGGVASGAYAAGAFATGSAVDGWDVTEGATTDAASSAGGVGSLSAKLREATSQLGSILTSVQAPLPPMSTSSQCSALCSNLVLESGGPHNLYSLEVSADPTLAASAWWVLLFNATSLPANGAITPFKCYAMPAATTVFSAAFPSPVTLSTGTTIGVSTTGCFTQTASIHAFISGDAQ